MLNYLKQPASISNKPWLTVVLASVVVFFILFFFQPFGLSAFSDDKWFRILGLTLITALATSFVTYLLPLVFKKFYDSENWTIGKNLLNICFILLTISIGNTVFEVIVSHRSLSNAFYLLLSYIIITFIVGIIPAVIIMFVNQNNQLKHNLREAKALNATIIDRLQQHILESSELKTDIITLRGTTKEEITLNPENIIYIEASGNYVRVYYVIDEKLKQSQLRTTISQIENELAICSNIIRCHRDYLVNVKQIVNIEGNSQGFQLKLRYSKEEISVSRIYTKTIQNKLNNSV